MPLDQSWFEVEVVDEHVDGPSWFVVDVVDESIGPDEPPVEPPAPLPVYGPFPWLRTKLRRLRRRKEQEPPQNRSLRSVVIVPLPSSSATIVVHQRSTSVVPLPQSRSAVHVELVDVVVMPPIRSRAAVHAKVSRDSSTSLPTSGFAVIKRDYLDDSEDLLIILSLL